MVIDTALVLVGLLAAVALLHLRGDRDLGMTAARAIFAVYLAGVAHYALLPIRFDPALARDAGPWLVQVGLHPFFLPGGDAMSRDQVVYNLLMGVPFGIGLPFITRGWSIAALLGAGIAFGFAIEGLQLLLNLSSLALPSWTIDINDVILNSAGAVLGVVGFIMARTLYGAAFGGRALRFRAWRHFHDVLVGAPGPTRGPDPAAR
ncbi:MAG: VanZ family protein [Chloroflexota bacterium]